MTKPFIVSFFVCALLAPYVRGVPGIPAMRPEVVLVLVALASRKARLSFSDPISRVFACLMGVAGLAIASSYLFFATPFNARDFVIFPMLIQYWLIYCFVRSINDPRQQLFAIKMIALFAALAGLVGIFQKFNIAGVNSWLTPHYLMRERALMTLQTGSVYGRVVGTIGDPRHFACILTIGGAAVLSLLLGVPGKRERLLYGTMGMACLVATFFTVSRTGILALATVFVIAGYLSLSSPRKLFRYLFITIMGTLVLFGVWQELAAPEIKDRFLEFDNTSFVYSKHARMRDMKEPFLEGMRNPLILVTGRGPSKAVLPGSEHSDIGWMAMRYGLMGLVCYMLLIGLSAHRSMKRYRVPWLPEEQTVMMFSVMTMGIWIIFVLAESVLKNGQIMSLNLAAMGLAFAPGLPPPFPFYPGPPPWAEGGAPMPMDPRQIPAPIQGQPY